MQCIRPTHHRRLFVESFRTMRKQFHRTFVSMLLTMSVCMSVSVSLPAVAQESHSVEVPTLLGTDQDVPKADDVDYIIAEAYSDPFSFHEDLPAFRVPSKSHESVLSRFRNCSIDTKPNIALPEIGTLRIVLKNGTSSRISWYWVGKREMRFSFRGIRCIRTSVGEKDFGGGDEAYGLWHMLWCIAEEAKESAEADKKGKAGATRVEDSKTKD